MFKWFRHNENRNIERLLIEGIVEMANLADNIVALQVAVAALQTPTVDLSTVAKADALAAVAQDVTDIKAQVTPTV